MEEEIEIIEDNIDEFMDILYETYRQSKVKPFEKAIEHLISAYKKLEEEFKTVDHECSRLEKKEYDKEDKYLVRIKELEEENKALKDKESDYMTVYMTGVYDEKKQWKQAIRNKIEEIKRNSNNDSVFMTQSSQINAALICCLQELEERNK